MITFGSRCLIRNVRLFILLQVSAACAKDCQCPPEVPRCAAGVSLILDSCGCCKVCARQLFEDCSQAQPCDHTKGLECNFGRGLGSAKGICRGTMTSFLLTSIFYEFIHMSHFKPYYFSCFSKTAKLDGRTCEYNNKIYQNGEIFRPNCKHQCTCMDGAVGCVSLCPHELTLPKLGCSKPERVKVRGQCCEQFICPEETKTKSSVVKKHRDRASEDDLSKKNELAPAWRGKAKSLPGEQFYTMTSLVKNY